MRPPLARVDRYDELTDFSTDDSMIPLDDLGLQLVEDGASTLRYLPFDAPSPELAVPFLELIALREGHILSRTAVSSLYASTIHASSLPWLTRGAADPLPHPFPTMPDPAADLRHALTQLQFSCQWGIGDTLGGIGWAQSSGENETVWSVGALPSVEPPKDLHLAHARRLEADQDSATIEDKTTISTIDAVVDSLSFADAYVSRRNVVLLEVSERVCACALSSIRKLILCFIRRITNPPRCRLRRMKRSAAPFSTLRFPTRANSPSSGARPRLLSRCRYTRHHIF